MFNANSDHNIMKIKEAIQIIKKSFQEGLKLPYIEDLAFIGNASDVYPWNPTQNIDLDICIIVNSLGYVVGKWLQKVSSKLKNQLANLDIKFEFRIVRGPYKQTPSKINNPFIFVHGAVFSEETYIKEGALLRYGWRKYKCIIKRDRLARLATSKPNLSELLFGKKGIEERLECISRGKVIMWERILPDLHWEKLEFGLDSYLFSEYCLAAGANTARNHARVLGEKEADFLSNDEFFQWYYNNVFSSHDLNKLIELKQRVRRKGYFGTIKKSKKYAEKYLTELRKKIVEIQI